MGKIRGLDGTLIDPPAEKPMIMVDQEHYLNLAARVQNMEAALVMLAVLSQKMMVGTDSHELDLVMEAFHRAQVQRGARHLESGSDSEAIFI